MSESHMIHRDQVQTLVNNVFVTHVSLVTNVMPMSPLTGEPFTRPELEAFAVMCERLAAAMANGDCAFCVDKEGGAP